jgi:hypothetical protein
MRTALARVLIAALLVEVTLRLALHVEPVRRGLAPVPEDVAGRVAFAYGGRGAGFDAGFVVPDPGLGWVAAAGGEPVDAHGLRDGGARPAPGAVRVALVGDSFAWGLGVPPDATFAHALELRRPDVDVLNLGVVGYGLDQAVLRLERDGAALRPDVVVLLGTSTLALRARHAFVNYAKPWFTLQDGLVLHGVPVPSPDALRARELRVPATWQVGRIVAERVERWRHPPADAAPVVDALLDRWRADVAASGAVPVLVTVPTPNEHGAGAGGEAYARWCSAHRGTCFDGWPTLLARSADGADLQEATTHWNVAGHAVVAEVVEAALVGAGAIPAAAR